MIDVNIISDLSSTSRVGLDLSAIPIVFNNKVVRRSDSITFDRRNGIIVDIIGEPVSYCDELTEESGWLYHGVIANGNRKAFIPKEHFKKGTKWYVISKT